MTDILSINEHIISYQEIKQGEYSQYPLTDYELHTLEFCRAWLRGDSIFEAHTSGSTGKPKSIGLQRSQMQASARLTGETLSLRDKQTALVCINTAYIGGKMMLVRGLELGLRLIIINPTSNPFEALYQLSQSFPKLSLSKIDFVALVPLQLENILGSEVGLELFSQVEVAIVGGAAVNEDTLPKLEGMKPQIYSTYGMTETVSHIALRKLNKPQAQDYYDLLPEVEIQVNTNQQLSIRAPMTRDEWITTNDVVEILSPKSFRWLGRVDNIINSGGIKIQIEVLENIIKPVLVEMNCLNSFFLAGLPDSRLGQKLVLVIEGELTKEVEEQLVTQKLPQVLSRYQLPKELIYVPKFTRTATQKVQRKLTLEQVIQ